MMPHLRRSIVWGCERDVENGNVAKNFKSDQILIICWIKIFSKIKKFVLLSERPH